MVESDDVAFGGESKKGHIPGKLILFLNLNHNNLTFLVHFDCAIGYSGYVPGVSSENVFGKTYGETSKDSASNNICRGRDLPSNLKYTTVMKAAHDDLNKVTAQSTAEIVGVPPGKNTYAKVSLCFESLKSLNETPAKMAPFLNSKLKFLYYYTLYAGNSIRC